MPDADTGAIQWTGWVRRRKGARWLRVCEAPTIGECARKLDAEGKRLGIADRHQVLVHGDHPPRPDRIDGRRPQEEQTP